MEQQVFRNVMRQGLTTVCSSLPKMGRRVTGPSAVAVIFLVITNIFLSEFSLAAGSGWLDLFGRIRAPVSEWPPRVRQEGNEIAISAPAFVSLSPDGTKLAIGHDDPHHPWFGIYSLISKQLQLLSLPPARAWARPRWSHDSTRLVTASSAFDPKTFLYDRSETRIDLIDARTQEVFVLGSGKGLRVAPFFSRDGKTVYYFLGTACIKECKTMGRGYDLYRYSLKGKTEERLTFQSWYQISPGDELADGSKVLFTAVLDSNKDVIISYGTSDKILSNNEFGLEGVNWVRAGSSGSIYVVALAGYEKNGVAIRDKSGFFQYSLFVHIPSASRPIRLVDMIWEQGHTPRHFGDYDIDSSGGALYCRLSDEDTASMNRKTLCKRVNAPL